MRITIALLILALLALQYKLWFSDSNLQQYWQLEKKIKQQQNNNQILQKRNQLLEANIEDFKSGSQALEEQARYELGMIKKGETYYQFLDPSE